MLEQLATVYESIAESGCSVIGLAPATGYQAKRLMDESIPFPLFIDRNHAVGKRLGVGRQTLFHFLFSVRGWLRYLKAFLAGNWQRRMTGHYSNLPAICVVDAFGDVTYMYRGSGLGDYPPLEDVLDALATTGS